MVEGGSDGHLGRGRRGGVMSHTRSLTAHSRTHTITHTHTHTRSLTHTHTQTLPHSQTHTHTLTLCICEVGGGVSEWRRVGETPFPLVQAEELQDKL